MKRHSIINILQIIALAAIFIVGCSAKVEVEAIEVTEDLIVTFDGSSCKYDGPQVIREGEITMIMNNLSDSPAGLDFAKLDSRSFRCKIWSGRRPKISQREVRDRRTQPAPRLWPNARLYSRSSRSRR